MTSIDRPLDEIIKEKGISRFPNRRNRGGNRMSGNRSNNMRLGGGLRSGQVSRNIPPVWRRDRYLATSTSKNTVVIASARLLVSNLDFNVSDQDIQELFGKVGRLRRACINYDKEGKSLGTAEIIYHTYVDAQKAVLRFHERKLDGRSLKIQMLDSNNAQTASINRIVPNGNIMRKGRLGPNVSNRRLGGRNGFNNERNNKQDGPRESKFILGVESGFAVSSTNNRIAGKISFRNQKKRKTKEELDSEILAYKGAN